MQLPLHRPPTLSIVVPVHNETGSIEPFLARTTPVLKGLAKNFDYEVVFVDDGSTDATLAELLEARKASPRIKVVAVSLPKLRDRATTLIRESALRAASSSASVASVEPSSMKTIS